MSGSRPGTAKNSRPKTTPVRKHYKELNGKGEDEEKLKPRQRWRMLTSRFSLRPQQEVDFSLTPDFDINRSAIRIHSQLRKKEQQEKKERQADTSDEYNFDDDPYKDFHPLEDSIKVNPLRRANIAFLQSMVVPPKESSTTAEGLDNTVMEKKEEEGVKQPVTVPSDGGLVVQLNLVDDVSCARTTPIHRLVHPDKLKKYKLQSEATEARSKVNGLIPVQKSSIVDKEPTKPHDVPKEASNEKETKPETPIQKPLIRSESPLREVSSEDTKPNETNDNSEPRNKKLNSIVNSLLTKKTDRPDEKEEASSDSSLPYPTPSPDKGNENKKNKRKLLEPSKLSGGNEHEEDDEEEWTPVDSKGKKRKKKGKGRGGRPKKDKKNSQEIEENVIGMTPCSQTPLSQTPSLTRVDRRPIPPLSDMSVTLTPGDIRLTPESEARMKEAKRTTLSGEELESDEEEIIIIPNSQNASMEEGENEEEEEELGKIDREIEEGEKQNEHTHEVKTAVANTETIEKEAGFESDDDAPLSQVLQKANEDKDENGGDKGNEMKKRPAKRPMKEMESDYSSTSASSSQSTPPRAEKRLKRRTRETARFSPSPTAPLPLANSVY